MRIGRGEGVEVPLAESGVSRLHAEIAVQDGRIVLIQKSRTNETRVNGFPVLDRVELENGDEIRLADRVVLGVRLNRPGRSGSKAVTGSNQGLTRQMENKIELDRSIEDFNLMGTFLDIDVVGSRGMKGAGARAEHIIVSFERFRAYVAGICQEWDGQVLNSNGDELMCFFESASSAVLAGSTILERLADFNRDLNLLSQDFRFRLGAHTGISLVDLAAGIAYSEVLDTAGHIQKQAEPDSLFISQTTLASLPRAVPVTPAGELIGEGGLLYRIDCFLSAKDFET
jgi:class 3 adenylate cyclase